MSLISNPDTLTRDLLELLDALHMRNVYPLICGGMGLYLRDKYPPPQHLRSPRYPVRPESRSTSDLDLMLTPEIITNAEHMHTLRDVLQQLGYTHPIAEHFQFAREAGLGATRVDLLAPRPEDETMVKISPPRVRPKAAKRIHAFLTEEASTIAHEPVVLRIGDDTPDVRIPSSLNLLILKLHAFRDRLEKEESQHGRHHAFDIFRIVTDMGEEDWESAGRLLELAGGDGHIVEARRLVHEHFSSPEKVGMLRLREHEGYRAKREEFDLWLPYVIDDLSELLPAP